MWKTALLAATVVCVGCTVPASIETAGTSDWTVEFNPDGTPKRVKIIDGKEKANVSFDVDLTTGKASYSATDVRAFDGQAFAADVAKVLAEEQGKTVREVSPSLVQAIVDVARLYLAP